MPPSAAACASAGRGVRAIVRDAAGSTGPEHVSVIIANIWIGIPFNLAVLYSGLPAVPRQVHEAAALDGATSWRQFWGMHAVVSPAPAQEHVCAVVAGFGERDRRAVTHIRRRNQAAGISV